MQESRFVQFPKMMMGWVFLTKFLDKHDTCHAESKDFVCVDDVKNHTIYYSLSLPIPYTLGPF